MTTTIGEVFPQPTSLYETLRHVKISVSAPCRVDCGGTLDIRPLSLLLQYIKPVTVNIALELRTRVELLPFEPGYIRITSDGFPSYDFRLADAPLSSPVGLVAAILYHFHVDGLHVQIRSDYPPKSGMGGSGAVALCVIASIVEVLTDLGYPKLSLVQQICLAQNIEESLGPSRSGLQDQAAAAYGGVNEWIWDYRKLCKPFRKKQLLGAKQSKELGKHIVVAFTGLRHGPSGLNKEWLDDFASGRVRSEWVRVNNLAICFGNALRASEWSLAARYLREECQIRLELWPNILNTIGRELVQAATDIDCGARFCGGGGGGCIWAIGEQRKIEDLRHEWTAILASTGEEGSLLHSKVATRGKITIKK
jgi:D-glycero-alpha-D-manno-heptose-7-phosphate kinase